MSGLIVLKMGVGAMAEKEYIEREAAIKAAVNGLRGVPSVAALEMIEALEDVPAADVTEVRHGYWESGKSGVMCFCTRCAFPAFPSESESWKYCPACGAKMDGKGRT